MNLIFTRAIGRAQSTFFLVVILSSLSFFSNASPLPAEKAFQTQVQQIDPNNFVINWQIKPGYFLYADRIKLTEPADSNVHLGAIRFPETIQKTDKQGRVFNVYRKNLALQVPVLGEQPGESLIKLNYQGCSDKGFCYPPKTKQIKLTIDKDLALSSLNIETADAVSEPVENQDSIENVIRNHHWSFVILSFWVFGLLLSFTPCVLPMIPVLSGIIVGHGAKLSTRKAFFLSLSYVLSMSVTYAIVGAVVAKLGANLQVLMQNFWAIGLFSLIFILLALSMFGFYELRLPVSWQARLAKLNRSQESGHYLSAAIMGCLSTLILSPCVTAPLIGALGYIAQSGNVVLGSATLFFLGLGMGTPLLLIGTSAGKFLPKAGKWMNAVKAFFGLVLVIVALFLLERILPKSLIMVFWAALFVFSGIYCGALKSAKTKQRKFSQGLGLMLLLYGLLILIGAGMGNINPLQPLARSEKFNPATTNNPQTVKSVSDLQQAIADAKGKPIMLDFYADWCRSCQVIEATLFNDPHIMKALEDFVVVRVDLTANKAQEQAILNQFKVVAPPTFLFLNREGQEQGNLRLVGEPSKKEFLSQLNEAGKT